MSTFASRIRLWDQTTASNNGVSPLTTPYGAQIGWKPSDVGALVRQHMLDHKNQWLDAEWLAFETTATRASATTFKLATDVTARLMTDLRLKFMDTTTLYGTVVSSSYSAPDTTVTVSLDSGSLTASLSAVALAIIKPTNSSLPRNSSVGKNIIIGGDFTTNPWQRGTSFTALANNTYGADRFKVRYSTTAVCDVLKTADAPTAAEAGVYSADCFNVDVTTADAAIAAGDYYVMSYIVEGLDIAKLGFGQSGTRYLTLSFWHKHTVTGTYCVAFQNSANDRSYVATYTQTTSDTWEKAVVTFAVDTTGTWIYSNGVGLQIFFAIAAGSTFQTTANAWAAGNYYATSAQANGLSANTNFNKFALVKLEVGQVVTPFELDDQATVLHKCMRYFVSYNSQSNNTYLGSGYSNATNQVFTQLQFHVPIRSAPTITFSAQTDFQVVYGAGSVVTSSAITATNVGVNGTFITTTVGTTPFTVGQGAVLRTISSASNAYMWINAEL